MAGLAVCRPKCMIEQVSL